MLKGDARPCFAIDFLKETEKSNMDDDQKLFALGSLLEAGSDTSRMTMSQLIAAAVLQPDWVERAREQLDRVCGDAQRLPRFEDKPNLPFITAAVKEGFRWYPFGPIGVPHMMSQDDEYEGYKLPAGTMVTWNMHHLSRSPDEYQDPERFWPERFMDDDLNNPLKGHWAFGAGMMVFICQKQDFQSLTSTQEDVFVQGTMWRRRIFGCSSRVCYTASTSRRCR